MNKYIHVSEVDLEDNSDFDDPITMSKHLLLDSSVMNAKLQPSYSHSKDENKDMCMSVTKNCIKTNINVMMSSWHFECVCNEIETKLQMKRLGYTVSKHCMLFSFTWIFWLDFWQTENSPFLSRWVGGIFHNWNATHRPHVFISQDYVLSIQHAVNFKWKFDLDLLKNSIFANNKNGKFAVLDYSIWRASVERNGVQKPNLYL